MSIKIHHFSLPVSCPVYDESSGAVTQTQYEDNIVLILPENYSENGAPTRLVIVCHGAGGTVSSDTSQLEESQVGRYLVANGYAVMDVNGLPERYASENGIDIRNNIGSPIAIRSYTNAYKYCISNFNLKTDVFVHGGSMGGISSTNLVLSGLIPVIAHSALCPVLDAYKGMFLHPWMEDLPKIALGKIYGLQKDGSGNYVYDAQKIGPYSPAQVITERRYPVPVKFWHCEDDVVVSCEVTKKFVAAVNESGGHAELVTFDHGRHEPTLVGDILKNPSGKTNFMGEEVPVRIAAEGVFLWIKGFDRD